MVNQMLFTMLIHLYIEDYEPTRTNIKNEINDYNFKSIHLTI
jgi:hypothetical protein